MSVLSQELELLERVFLRVASGDTDEKLENSVFKFLPPVLLKMSSEHEPVRTKVFELCVHISKRLKSRPLINLPVEDLLSQYTDNNIPLIVKNLTIVYIKMGYPRLEPENQVKLIPIIISAMKEKPQEHVDSLCMLVIGALNHIQWPRDPEKRHSVITSEEKPAVLLEVMLDVLLMPDSWKQNSDIPPGLCPYSVKRITNNINFDKIPLEKVKISILTTLINVYKPNEILCHLVAGAADQWCSVSDEAERSLKKFYSEFYVDWSNPKMLIPLYNLYLGTEEKTLEKKRVPANLRLKLKILPQLAKGTGEAVIWPICIKIIFDALHGETASSGNITPKLVDHGLTYFATVISAIELNKLKTVARILLDSGLQKLIPVLEGSPLLRKVYSLIGMLVNKVPDLVKNDFTLLSKLFNIMSQEQDQFVQGLVRETLLIMVCAFSPSDLLLAFLATQIKSPSLSTRLVALHYVSRVFPSDFIEARFWLLTATGDSSPEVATEGLKSLYGESYRPGSKWKPVVSQSVSFPDFSKLTSIIVEKSAERKANPSLRVIYNKKTLPFDVNTYTNIIIYLRLCLLNVGDIDIHKDQESKIVDTVVTIKQFLGNKVSKDILDAYLNLCIELLESEPGIVPLTCVLEICGAAPETFASYFVSKLKFIKSFLLSKQSDVRECASMLLAIVLTFGCEQEVVESEIQSLLTNLQNGGKDFEHLHGCLLTLGYILERYFTRGRILSNWPHLKKCVTNILPYLDHTHPLLINAACVSLGQVCKATKLPIDDDSDGSENLLSSQNISKMGVLKKLQSITDATNSSFQLVENAYKAIGSFCLNSDFPYRQYLIDGAFGKIKATKAVDIHICLGEVLVNCALGPLSPSARDFWIVSIDKFEPPSDILYSPNDILSELLQKLLSVIIQDPHPHSRQACCLWLFGLLKNCSHYDVIKNRLMDIQSAFFDLLSENNDIVQDTASKGLAMVYESSNDEMKSELIKMLIEQLTQGRRTVVQVTQDTELFEKGALGTTPSGGNLSTYRELCSLASELNQPDLIYKFMNLANHNAAWTSKMGAAFGFSTIASVAGEQLSAHKAKIVPKLYRYQFDPTPKVQNSMASIWYALVPEPIKTVDEYHREIFSDLIVNLTSNQWRVRISCCLALTDFLVSGGKRVFEDCLDLMPNLWSQLFRVMDDVHEQTRKAANDTMKSVSKLCLRCCEGEDKKTRDVMIRTLLPILESGIEHQVLVVRVVSIKTLSRLTDIAGELIKPHITKLVPTLLKLHGDMIEQTNLILSESHSLSITALDKCVNFIDGDILGEMLQSLVDLLKSSSYPSTRILTAEFIIRLSNNKSVDELQPHVGKLLTVLVNGLSDRKEQIVKMYAKCIGNIVKAAKDSSIDRLIDKLKNMYIEREDENTRLAICLTLHAITNTIQQKIKTRAEVVVPLVFFGMHANAGSKWEEVWHEVTTGGTEGTLQKHIDVVCKFLQNILQSASWPVRAQAAKTMKTLAEKIGDSLEPDKRNFILDLLISGLQGRTWDGKEYFLIALSTFCKNNRSLKGSDKENIIIETVLKETKKNDLFYKKVALKAVGDILESLEIDRFSEIYSLVNDILEKDSAENDDISENQSKKQQNLIDVRVVAFETLGKAWPNNEDTQIIYREKVIVQCVSCLKSNTRPVQVSIMASVIKYVEKLTLFSEESIKDEDLKELEKLISYVLQALSYALSIPKHTQLRKEALNVILLLIKKLQGDIFSENLNKLNTIFNENIKELSRDEAPEVRTRLMDIKESLKLMNKDS